MKFRFVFLTLVAWFVSSTNDCSAQPAQKTENKQFPLVEQVLPDELFVVVYSHKVPDGKNSLAWSYVTDGLAKAGQPEMIMTLLQGGKNASEFPQDPFLFFRTIYSLAKQGKLVHEGGYTRLGSGGKQFIAPQFNGAIYMPAQQFEGVKLSSGTSPSMTSGTLAVLPVTSEELDVYDLAGPSRVTARLSSQSKFYPYPTWCDMSRVGGFSQKEFEAMKEEPVSKVPTAFLLEAGIMAEGTNLSLSVPSDAQKDITKIFNSLPKDAPIKLNLGVDPRANAFLVWSQEGARAVAPPGSDGSRMSGSYVEILPGTKKSEFALFRDGYVVMLTDDEFKKLKSSVVSGKDYAITDPTGDELKIFSISFPKTIYRNPLDGKSYHASGGWQKAVPNNTSRNSGNSDTKQTKSNDAAETASIVLLTDQNLIEKHMPASALIELIKDIEKTTKNHFSKAQKQSTEFRMIIQCDVAPGNKAKFLVGAKPNGLSPALVKSLYTQLNTIKIPSSKGAVSFQVLFRIWPKK